MNYWWSSVLEVAVAGSFALGVLLQLRALGRRIERLEGRIRELERRA